MEFSAYNILTDIVGSPNVSYGKCEYKDGVLSCSPNSSCHYKLDYKGGDFLLNGLKIQSNIDIKSEGTPTVDGRFVFDKIKYKLRVKYYKTRKDKAGLVIEYENGVCENILCFPYYDQDVDTRGYIDSCMFTVAGEAVASVILTIYNNSEYDVDIRNLGVYKSETVAETVDRFGGGIEGGGTEVTSPKIIGFINGTADVMIETMDGTRNIWVWSERDTKLTEQTSGHTIEINWNLPM